MGGGCLVGGLAIVMLLLIPPVAAEQESGLEELRKGAIQTPTSEEPRRETPQQLWHYGAFLDGAYLIDPNFPSNHLFRSRTTANRVNEGDLNMAAVYVKKDVSESSRWGTELLVQGGNDTQNFAFSATAPRLPGSSWLRDVGRANVSYLAPLGNGMTVQAGIFNSFLGYDSLYAKDNFSYTRPWTADNAPYVMMGMNATYPFTERVSGALFIIHQYAHLADANGLPSYGAQVSYIPTASTTLKQTFYYGPDQSDTSWRYYRLFSDSIAQWTYDIWSVALEYQIGTEQVVGGPRAFWMGSQLPIHYIIGGPWSVTLRPEFYWDRNGRITGFEQIVVAVTSTLEYRFSYYLTNTLVRLEYRFDNSHGSQGGFFTDGEIRPGVVGLTPSQNLIILALIWTFDEAK